jgi:hypothetical protein
LKTKRLIIGIEHAFIFKSKRAYFGRDKNKEAEE